MYCSKCKIKVDNVGVHCPVCGSRMSENEFDAGSIVDDNCIEDRRGRAKRGVRFNFSKPLCLFFAALLIATLFIPWFSVTLTVDQITLFDGKKLSMMGLQPFVRDCFATYKRFAGANMAVSEDTLWLINGMLLLVKLYFVICAINLLLFGLIGLFSKGKLRYFFARVGSTALFIGIIAVMIAALVGSAQLRKLGGAEAGFTLDLRLCFWLFVSALAALLFRILGMRLLRYTNGISCLNRGDYATAEKEFIIINCVKKLPKTFSKAKHRRAARHNTYGESNQDYGDGVL